MRDPLVDQVLVLTTSQQHEEGNVCDRPALPDCTAALARAIPGRLLRPTDFVLCIQRQLFEVAGFPVAQVGFHDHVRRL